MPNVTVVGPDHTVVDLIYSNKTLAAIAQELANVINGDVGNGTLLSVDKGPTDAPPALPPGQSGELVDLSGGPLFVPAGYEAVVANGNHPVIFGNGGTNETVLSGAHGLTYFTDGGSGTVAAGGGANHIVNNDGGSYYINTGSGDDTIESTSGSATIAAFGGNNTIILGSGTAFVQTTGNDRILDGSGATTVNVAPLGSAYVQGGSGTLLFNDQGAASTVVGGSGTETIFGGNGASYFTGGSDGMNFIYGAGTLIGGGAGDTINAQGSTASMIEAAAGNETLSAALSTGNDIFQFTKASVSGSYSVLGFDTGSDTVSLVGYASNEAAKAEQTATVSGGSTTFHLPNNVTITFTNVSDPKSIHIT